MIHILDYIILSTTKPCSYARTLGSAFRRLVVGIQRCSMTFAKTIAVLKVSLMRIHCSSDDDAGTNFPGSTENEFSLLLNGGTFQMESP